MGLDIPVSAACRLREGCEKCSEMLSCSLSLQNGTLEHLGIFEIAHFAAILNRGTQEFRKEFKINALLILLGPHIL